MTLLFSCKKNTRIIALVLLPFVVPHTFIATICVPSCLACCYMSIMSNNVTYSSPCVQIHDTYIIIRITARDSIFPISSHTAHHGQITVSCPRCQMTYITLIWDECHWLDLYPWQLEGYYSKRNVHVGNDILFLWSYIFTGFIHHTVVIRCPLQRSLFMCRERILTQRHT